MKRFHLKSKFSISSDLFFHNSLKHTYFRLHQKKQTEAKTCRLNIALSTVLRSKLYMKTCTSVNHLVSSRSRSKRSELQSHMSNTIIQHALFKVMYTKLHSHFCLCQRPTQLLFLKLPLMMRLSPLTHLQRHR